MSRPGKDSGNGNGDRVIIIMVMEMVQTDINNGMMKEMHLIGVVLNGG